jgi:predicted MFS family arabinose efflux permease
VAEPTKLAVPAEEIVPPRGFGGFIGKFTVIFAASRELWLTFAIKFLIYTAYSITNKTMVLWLSKDLGFSDPAAGALVGWVWAPAMTVFTLLAGSLTDAIGLRRTFFLGVAICTVARTVMATTTIPWLALLCGVLPLAVGEALGTPVLLAATRVYSTTRQRSMAFSIIYAIMNVGYLAAGYIFDFVRQMNVRFSIFGYEPTTHQQLFLVSLALEIVLFPTIYFLRRRQERERESHPTALATVRASAAETIDLFKRLLGQSAFFRLLVFFLLIGFLKAIFLQMDYVFPKFGDRELGLNAPVGKIAGINSLIIIFLAPIVGALTQKFSAYRMVVVGGAICAAGVFVMALPTTWFESMANGRFGDWLGHGYLRLHGPVHPYYVMSAIYLAIFSVGEAFYSPRVYEYAAAIAPPGQEASYGALAYLPFLVGKLLVGTSGWLLAAFCPAQGPRHSGMMWFVFACAASIAPLGLLIFRNYIRVPEAGRAD